MSIGIVDAPLRIFATAASHRNGHGRLLGVQVPQAAGLLLLNYAVFLAQVVVFGYRRLELLVRWRAGDAEAICVVVRRQEFLGTHSQLAGLAQRDCLFLVSCADALVVVSLDRGLHKSSHPVSSFL